MEKGKKEKKKGFDDALLAVDDAIGNGGTMVVISVGEGEEGDGVTPRCQ